MADSIAVRYIEVLEKINEACIESGRNKKDVNLIVVTKGHSAKEIIEVVNAGACNIGENYPEETLEKIYEIDGQVDPIWHMIGHLQSRKIKLMFPIFKMIHSVDRFDLAKKLDKFYAAKNSIADVLIEVNLSGETSKFGFEAESPRKRDTLTKEFNELFSFANLKIRGLMTMPPLAQQEDQNKACYNLCHELLHTIREKYRNDHFDQLSMGTSADYITAVNCGATFVRVGEAIMGKRINKGINQ